MIILERCHLITMDTRIPSKADAPEYTFALAYRKPEPIPKTWEAMAGDNGVSFLDLPRELRDMIYNYICTDLPQIGDGWRDKHDEGKYGIPAATEAQADILHDCNIMRTCRQVHWEFAEMLYAQPLQICSPIYEFQTQFILPGSHILPLSPTYADLVKKVAVLHDTEIGHTRDQYHKLGKNTSVENHWRNLVTIATQLGKLFPKIQTVRVLYRICPRDYSRDKTFQTLCGLHGDTREKQVEKSETFIKGVCWSDGRPVKLPPQLELVNLDFDTIVETPLVEAIKNVRAAELQKKELKGKQCA
ncbi:uncharacterized protein J4E87_004765 [Alternaria ethzedia]|uniref:uncharacterized protein n=1 Tax=Alternaria ethzedia TaxID=181014 RepID=UPI0020C4B441|nr:uncharacterized protein J4E87_004765 [Alternaria ethzedia]KAI4626264.1 hypothetical protein J4E87_004765 [Alternaria ethzedia]